MAARAFGRVCVLGFLLATAACKGGALGSVDAGPSPEPDAATMPAGPDGGFVVKGTTARLIASDFTITSGQEHYQCQRLTATKDLYVLQLTPVSPVGVHHAVVAIDPGSSPDGTSSCGPIGTMWRPLFASGVGSPSLTMPPGVALKISAGQKIVLDLHLFNATPATLTGTAAIDVVLADDPSALELAGVAFVGPLNFTIDASRQVQGACTMSNATKFFAVFPHMHQTGQHIKVWTENQVMPTVVWDHDYNFQEQKFGAYTDWDTIGEIPLAQGDQVHVQCTYTQAGVGVSSGDSTTEEMCFGISYFHPAISTTLGTPFCVF